MIEQDKKDVDAWIENGGEALCSHDGETVCFVLTHGELTPELQEIQSRIQKWSPEQFAAANDYITRAAHGGLKPAMGDTRFGQGKRYHS